VDASHLKVEVEMARPILAVLMCLGMAASSYVLAPAQPQLQVIAVAAPATSCGHGETYVKSYKKADGTVVSGYCRHSAASAKDCFKGEAYVHGYTKADGTVVKGYCRKVASG
jgi:hypothetical protein